MTLDDAHLPSLSLLRATRSSSTALGGSNREVLALGRVRLERYLLVVNSVSRETQVGDAHCISPVLLRSANMIGQSDLVIVPSAGRRLVGGRMVGATQVHEVIDFNRKLSRESTQPGARSPAHTHRRSTDGTQENDRDRPRAAHPGRSLPKSRIETTL